MDEDLGALIAEAIRLLQEIQREYERGLHKAASRSLAETIGALSDTLERICDLLEPGAVEIPPVGVLVEEED